MHIADLVPSDDVLVALEPEELGLLILQVLAAWPAHIMTQMEVGTFIKGALQSFANSNRRQEIGDAIREAWAWLAEPQRAEEGSEEQSQEGEEEGAGEEDD